MKTKQNFFSRSALVVTAAAALAGCVKEKITPAEDCELKFVVTANAPSDGDVETRALKPDWVEGDKIVVFFDANATQYAFFNYDGTDWVISGGIVNTDAVNASGPVQAVHAGGGSFNFDGTTLSGISGDILYDQTGGTYTVDAGTQTAYINVTMERGFTTAIKMQGSADQATNEKWRLAGSNLWVMGSTTSQTATNLVQNPEFYIQALFVPSDAANEVAASPDAVFTDGTQAVFHVWDKSADDDGTSIDVYSTDDATKIYERDYTDDLTVGSTTIIMSPDSGEQSEWSGTTTPVSSTAVALEGVTAPVGGATPATTVTSSSDEFTTAITWSPEITSDPAVFAAGTAYTATITLTSAAGKTFTGSGFDDATAAAGFTAGGMAPTTATNTGDALELTYTFPVTPATLVTAAALTDVVAPEAGATPSTTINTASTQFTAALAWNGNPTTFAQGTTYTANITLTAAANYTFEGGFADTAAITGFTVNGQAPTWVSNDGTTLVLSYTFAATSANNAIYDAGDDDVTLN